MDAPLVSITPEVGVRVHDHGSNREATLVKCSQWHACLSSITDVVIVHASKTALRAHVLEGSSKSLAISRVETRSKHDSNHAQVAQVTVAHIKREQRNVGVHNTVDHIHGSFHGDMSSVSQSQLPWQLGSGKQYLLYHKTAKDGEGIEESSSVSSCCCFLLLTGSSCFEGIFNYVNRIFLYILDSKMRYTHFVLPHIVLYAGLDCSSRL